MDNQVIINTKTYDIENQEEYFNCDKEISEAISILNKKGYYTEASCAGHIKFIYREQDNIDNEFLDNIKGNIHFIMLREKEDSFDALARDSFAQTYIKFKNNYSFKTIPDGFEYSKKHCILQAHVWYYINDGIIKKSYEEIDEELKKYQNNLLIWARKLPVNK
ncbi:MAG: hypothetical protein IJ704_01795 [Bacilli bacterium]|nr:hypothetical protein [Bacilli bacterium]